MSEKPTQTDERPTPDVKQMGAVTISRNGYIEDLERQLAELTEHVGLCHDAVGERRGSDTSELWKFFEDHAVLIKRLHAAEDQRDAALCRKGGSMIDWEKYNRSQAAITGLGFVEVDIKDYEEMRAALQQRDTLAEALRDIRSESPAATVPQWIIDRIDACHDGEKVLTPDQCETYHDNLCSGVSSAWSAPGWVFHSTAEQRALALFQTLGGTL